ncbi:methyltransferase [Sphingomonas changnyeongensis]|uniref:Methyltransferase n=1 Tax=Sphingomonas changnyeongensis TaxID=2698679 RepID=A0A7Z2S5L1_9SPHN|nr:methyltransferase [Sphingomonas changnyeongensis]QHL91245.1 methyltransferase [Sphingomonas changnyeongensis]
MSQNRSTAVMQRRVEAHDSLEDFPTPPWATRALCEWLLGLDMDISLDAQTVREPAANRGHMVRPLAEYFAEVRASDVHDYGVGFPVADYLFGPADQLDLTDWTITNPPFRLAEQFIARALETSRMGVAMILRTSFLEGVGRFERLFSIRRPSWALQFTERVVMHKGKLSANGSTATSYAWLVWQHGKSGTRLDWIAPCRRHLERATDYQNQDLAA